MGVGLRQPWGSVLVIPLEWCGAVRVRPLWVGGWVHCQRAVRHVCACVFTHACVNEVCVYVCVCMCLCVVSRPQRADSVHPTAYKKTTTQLDKRTDTDGWRTTKRHKDSSSTRPQWSPRHETERGDCFSCQLLEGHVEIALHTD